MVVILASMAAGLATVFLATTLWPARQFEDVGAAKGPGWGEAAASAVNLYRSTADPLGRWAVNRGMSVRANPADLAITGRDPEAVLSAKIVGAAGASLASLLVGAVLIRMAGLQASVLFFLLAMVALGGAAYLLPDVIVRRQARVRRDEFVQALPVWCDLVALEMAGAAAPQEALVTAAEAGTTWPMFVLRDTLQRAVLARQGHWQALTDLGDRIGVPDLAELGRLSQLVSHEGAQVRDTLIERAASIRRRTLAGALGQASQRDESMRLAVLVVGAGVIGLMIFPGAIAVMNL